MTYIGHAEDGKPHGFGYMTFSGSHDQHQGEFREGRAHGPGVLIRGTGEELEGNWVENKRVGQFTVIKPSGAKFTETYNEEGKLVGRKKVEDAPPEPPSECWGCGGKFRATYNNPYACRVHRGEWRWRSAMRNEPDDPGVWACCVKEHSLAPGCHFVEHNLDK